MARILLADDDAATRDLVRRALEADGHSVHVTQDGSEALECVEGSGAQKFDVLVSDVEMPLLDGVALAQRALKQPNLRVLLMSGFAEQLDRAKALKSSQGGGAVETIFARGRARQRAQAARLAAIAVPPRERTGVVVGNGAAGRVGGSVPVSGAVVAGAAVVRVAACNWP